MSIILKKIYKKFFKTPTKDGGKSILYIERSKKRCVRAAFALALLALTLTSAVSCDGSVDDVPSDNAPVSYSLRFDIENYNGKDRSVKETKFLYDYLLEVGAEYSLNIDLDPSRGAPMDVAISEEDRVIYDETLIELRFDGIEATIKPLKPFESAAVTFELAEEGVSGVIIITAVEELKHFWS